MQLTRKTNIIKQDIEVEGKSYEAINQFIYLGSQINSKNCARLKITEITMGSTCNQNGHNKNC